MFILGVAGKAGSGKDTVAAWIRDEYRAYIRPLAFPIKLAIAAMLYTDVSEFNDRAWKETPLPDLKISPRVLAQTLGTEWGRALHPDFWLIVLERHLRFLPGTGIVVIPDVRFENEAHWIRERKGFVIHLTRAGADGNVGIENHASEQGILLGERDVCISNDGSIDDLHDKCRYVLGPRLEGRR
jgi:hypothetical protein